VTREILELEHTHVVLCTRTFLYVPYSFLLISNKFCKGGGGGRSAVMLLNRTGGHQRDWDGRRLDRGDQGDPITGAQSIVFLLTGK
jgi:hypothetical protein